MELEEQFESSDILISRQKRILRQVKIAENFAIGFTEWILKNQDMEFDADSNEDGIKQLLEIYKKTL